jgi:hypothetical protein
MTKVTVTNTLISALGAPRVDVPVGIALCADTFGPGGTGGQYELLGETSYVHTDTAGTYTLSVEPNTGGTFYIVTEPNSVTHKIIVPAGGPYWLHDVLADDPVPPPGNGVLYLRVDGTQALSPEQQAFGQGNLGISGGGSGTVTSVNGQNPDGTGNVTLTAAEVGADAAGAAATAQTNAETYADGKLAKASNLSDVADVPTARTNLGLGSAATHAATDFDAAGAAAAAQTAAQAHADAGDATEAAARAAADALLIPLAQKGAASGVATLDSGGKVPITQLPSSVMEYQGTWNAATNTPTLVDGTGNTGDNWRVTVAGSHDFGHGAISFLVGDIAIYDGTQWQRASAPDGVSSVAGRIGDVTLVVGDISGAVPSTRQITAGTGLSGGGDLSADRTISMPNVGTAATKGSASKTVTATTDAQGRVTSLTDQDIAISEAQVTNLTSDLAAKASALNVTGVKTANYTAALWDLVRCDTTGGSFTVTLPAASGGKGRVAIKLVTAVSTLNLALTGADHFNTSTGPTTGTLTLANQGIVVESDGSGVWTVTADDLPLTTLDGRYVAKSTVSGKGSLIVGTASGTVADLPVGATTGMMLQVDPTQADGMKWGTGNSALVPSGLWVALNGAANGQVTPTKNQEYAVPFLVGPQTINQLAFLLANTPDSGAVVRLGIRADAGGKPGAPQIDNPITVTVNAWNSVTVNYAHPGGILWVTYTSQNWTTTGPALSTAQSSANSGVQIGTGSALSTLGWATGHGPQIGSQSGVSGALPSTFTNTQTTNANPALIAAKGA